MSDQGESRLRRRSVLVRVSLGSALAMAIRPSGAAEGEDATCDQAPELVPVQGCTDRDPNDAPGRGRRCAPTGCTDNDPNDAPGRGIRCRPRGCTDNDPNDAPGRGVRCGVRRSCTDSDPNDAPGRGRRC